MSGEAHAAALPASGGRSHHTASSQGRSHHNATPSSADDRADDEQDDDTTTNDDDDGDQPPLRSFFEWEAGLPGSGKWTRYTRNEQVLLNTDFHLGRSFCNFFMQGEQITVDYRRQTHTNTTTSMTQAVRILGATKPIPPPGRCAVSSTIDDEGDEQAAHTPRPTSPMEQQVPLQPSSPSTSARRAAAEMRGSGSKGLQMKVLVIGDSNVGKTSFIKQYAHGTFSQQYRATVGVDFALKIIKVNNKRVKLQLWDIAGQEQFGSMTRVYYKNAVGAFIMFDLTAEQPLANVQAWKADLDAKVALPEGGNVPAILLGNKCDSNRAYATCSVQEVAKACEELDFTGWFEVSAKLKTNVAQAADFLVQRILDEMPAGSDFDVLEGEGDTVDLAKGTAGAGGGAGISVKKDRKGSGSRLEYGSEVNCCN